jgi:hypothetical protein
VTGERGTALVGTLVIGFLVVLAIGQALLTLGHLSAASADAADVAVYAAQYGARYGDPSDAAGIARRLLPDANVSSGVADGAVWVEVRVAVPLIGPGGGPLQRTVVGRATSELGPYRSMP